MAMPPMPRAKPSPTVMPPPTARPVLIFCSSSPDALFCVLKALTNRMVPTATAIAPAAPKLPATTCLVSWLRTALP
jgi:hypothetical protein